MSIYYGRFQPHKLANSQLYIQRSGTTVSLCPDLSSNALNFTQGVAANQPTLGASSIIFTTNDFMNNTTANVFSSINTGRIYFSGFYATAGGLNNIILASADTATANHFFDFRIDTSGRLAIITRTASGSNIDSLQGNTVLVNDEYYHGWIETNGSTWTAKLNGVTQTISVVLGSNAGRFFNDVPNRDNLTIGASVRNTTLFGNAKINKVYFNSGTISATDHWKLERFFENPLNYV
jgi:hypothetical protein